MCGVTTTAPDRPADRSAGTRASSPSGIAATTIPPRRAGSALSGWPSRSAASRASCRFGGRAAASSAPIVKPEDRARGAGSQAFAERDRVLDEHRDGRARAGEHSVEAAQDLVFEARVRRHVRARFERDRKTPSPAAPSRAPKGRAPSRSRRTRDPSSRSKRERHAERAVAQAGPPRLSINARTRRRVGADDGFANSASRCGRRPRRRRL